jgi:hypothetical protein
MYLLYSAYLLEFLEHLLFPVCFPSTVPHFYCQSVFISFWKTFTTMVFLTFHSSSCCYSIGRNGTCRELCTYSLQRELYSFNIIPIAVLFVLAARNHFFVCTFFGQ